MEAEHEDIADVRTHQAPLRMIYLFFPRLLMPLLPLCLLPLPFPARLCPFFTDLFDFPGLSGA